VRALPEAATAYQSAPVLCPPSDHYGYPLVDHLEELYGPGRETETEVYYYGEEGVKGLNSSLSSWAEYILGKTSPECTNATLAFWSNYLAEKIDDSEDAILSNYACVKATTIKPGYGGDGIDNNCNKEIGQYLA
jgi:hypothetical protein